jgi:hypothetical protein
MIFSRIVSKRKKTQYLGGACIIFFVVLGVALWFLVRVPETVKIEVDASDSLEVVREEVHNGVEVRVRYPRPPYAAAREYISESVDRIVDDVVDARNNDAQATAPYMVSVNYDTVFDTSHRITTYVVFVGTYTGGAHGMQQFIVAPVWTKTGELLTLRDVVIHRPAFWGAVVPFVRSELLSRGLDSSFITFADGTEGLFDNYRFVAFENTGFRIYFPPYAVAPYAAGSQQVFVPYSVTSSSMRFGEGG